MHPTITPRIQRASIYTIRGATAALLAGWIIYDEAYADQLTKSKLHDHDTSDGYSGMPTTAIVLRMKGLHTQSSWSNRESMRRGGSRSYEVTTLLSISKRKKRPNYWKMNKQKQRRGHNIERYIHTQYTLENLDHIPDAIGYVGMNKIMLLHWYVWLWI